MYEVVFIKQINHTPTWAWDKGALLNPHMKPFDNQEVVETIVCMHATAGILASMPGELGMKARPEYADYQVYGYFAC